MNVNQLSLKGHAGVGMLNDIWATPEILEAALKTHIKSDDSVSIPALEKPMSKGTFEGKSALKVMSSCAPLAGAAIKNKITIIGCGTSWHASLLAEYLIEHIARIPVECQYASEFRHRQPLFHKGDTLIIVSNSGSTEDSVECLKLVRRLANAEVFIVAVVNNPDSVLAREADAVFATDAGKEEGVASTKVFEATMLAFVLLAIALGQECGTFPESERVSFVKDLRSLPDKVRSVIERESGSLRATATQGATPLAASTRRASLAGGPAPLAAGECKLWDIGCQNVLASNFIFLGRGFNFPVALEGAMKCKEVAYIHAEGYPAAEMKHGPIALIDQFMPVVFICPQSDPSYAKIKANIMEVQARQGAVIVITEDDNTDIKEVCEHVIGIPATHEYLVPLVAGIPLQLLACMMGILRGNDIDAPRGLVKSHVAGTAEASFNPAAR